MNTRDMKDKIMQVLIYFSSGFTLFILVLIVGFIFIKGIPHINMSFLTNDYNDKTSYVITNLSKDNNEEVKDGYLASLGVTVGLTENKEQLEITKIAKDSPVINAVDIQQTPYKLKKQDLITKIGSSDVDEIIKKNKGDQKLVLQEITKILNETADPSVRLKVVRPGGGIVPMLVTTLYMIFLSLVVAAPIGILSAIYLNEYAKQGKIVTVIRFAIQNLAGIPSIIYGLFGALFFVQILKMKYSILAGALTVSIILLPVIIATTEETLKAIPKTYRESSLGLGATKLQTTMKVVLPNALPGILVAIILSIGRIVGESAALLLTAGTVAQIPGALTGDKASGATLTIKAYTILKEEGNIGASCAIGVVLIVLIFFLNMSSKYITKKFLAKNNG